MSPIRSDLAVLNALTDKQREVLTHVSEGLTSKEIARKLGISESAVNQRIETIRQRLGGMPRSQIARLHRRQNTVVMTIPTSNSLTGNPIALQSASGVDQASVVEGVVDLAAPRVLQAGDVLQPSTISQRLDMALTGPRAGWVRIGAIVLLAAVLATTAVLVLNVIQTLDALIGQ
jgi:DNA-binding CsgD family transcriptional regulator